MSETEARESLLNAIAQGVVGDGDESEIPWGAEDLERAGWPRNDVGNAKRLMARRGRDMLFVPEAGWYAWTGTRWSVEDGRMMALKWTHETAQAVRFEAKAMKENPVPDWFVAAHPEWEEKPPKMQREWFDYCDKHRGWAVTSGNAGRIEAMLSQAEPYLATRAADLDARRRLLTVLNGTLDLSLSVDAPEPLLRGANRDDLITKCAEVAYNPEARAPGWRAFLERVQPKEHVRAFLQRFMGYCLTGETGEQKTLMLTGVGQNGKSVFIDVIARIMGDYSAGVPFSSLLHNDRKSGSEATPDLVKTEGARLVRAAEPEKGARFSESRLKELTGGEAIQIRRLHKEFHDVRVQFKLVLSFNNKPRIHDTTKSIWRRILLVPWEVTIPEEEARLDLADHLVETEAAGILNWLVDGYLDWAENGLRPPDEVKAATEAYRAESDPIADFLTGGCEEGPGFVIQAATFYDGYKIWCKKNGKDPVTSTSFGRNLVSRGVPKEKQGVIVYLGYRLLPNYDPMAQRDIDDEDES